MPSRKVSYVKMHSTIFIPEVGQLGPALDSHSYKQLGALTYTETDKGVTISGPISRSGKLFEALVPFSNIQTLVYAQE